MNSVCPRLTVVRRPAPEPSPEPLDQPGPPCAARFLLPYTTELACNAGVVAKAYLNQHWIPRCPRRPALVHVLRRFAGRESLKAGVGRRPIRGVQGLARTAKWTPPSSLP